MEKLSEEIVELIGKGKSKDAAFAEMEPIEKLRSGMQDFDFFILTPIQAQSYGCICFSIK